MPRPGFWREVLNSDAGIYGGSNKGNLGGIKAEGAPCHGQGQSAEFYLPPISVSVFRHEQ
jgi:1,4-alpha-glucan branching enzyme